MPDDTIVASPGAADLMIRAHEAFVALDGALDPTQRSWLEQVPLARGIEAVDAHPVGSRLTFVNPATRAVAEEVTTLGGEAWRDVYIRLLLLALLIRTLTRPIDYTLPLSIAPLLNTERRRIIERATAADAALYEVDEALVRDWGFCLGTVLPFGVFFGHLSSSVARDTLTSGGLGHLAETPWLNLHLNVQGGTRYSADAREFGRFRIADFLRHNPTYQGMFGVGWLTDPAVGEISPHLTSVRQELESNGVVFVRLDTADAATVTLATGTSNTRRSLYEEGQYTPTEYMTIWARDHLLRWREAALQRRAQST